MRTEADMTEEEIEEQLQIIARLPHETLARLHRFSPAGHPYFVRESKMHAAFKAAFQGYGGMTPTVSKAIGWR